MSGADRLARAELEADLRDRAFDQAPGRKTPGGVGLELELIPVSAETGRVMAIEAVGRPSTLGFLRTFSRGRGWSESLTPIGCPHFRLPRGGVLTFEPGGQLEYASPPQRAIPGLMATTRSVLEPLVAAAADEGIRMVTRGVDPETPLAEASLQLENERYRRMAAHFDRYGEGGRRMMRQSAALHINVDIERNAFRRWRVASFLAPYLTALFANSPRAEGRETGHRSFRAHQWREVDPRRTGVPMGPDPVESYLELALEAPAFLLGREGEPARPFRSWLEEEGVGVEAWRAHLSTLFPEVRPRGYLEVRSVDALPLRWCAAPVVLLLGLLYDDEALREAERILEPPGAELLKRGGRAGVRDPEIRHRAVELFELGLTGAARLGEAVGEGEELEVARAYLRRFPARGRDPGDEDWGEPTSVEGASPDVDPPSPLETPPAAD